MRNFNKYKNNRNFKRETASDRYFSSYDAKSNNTAPIANTNIDAAINMIAMKDRPKSSYAIKVDPYTQANESQSPYNMITRYNTSFAPRYQGEANIDGGYVSQYMTSNESRMLNCFDAMCMEIGINYRLLHIDDRVENRVLHNPDAGAYRGSQIIRKMYDAVNEAFSLLEVTTFQTLTLASSYGCYSTIRIPDVDCQESTAYVYSGINHSYSRQRVYCYTDAAAVFLLANIEYQSIIGQLTLDLKYINKIKGYESELLKMNYLREIAPLNELFGQLNKSAFVTKLNSLVLAIKGEYSDVDWFQQTNIVTQISSRKADDVIDPVLEINAVYNLQPVCILFTTNDKQGYVAPENLTYDDVTTNGVSLIWNGGYGLTDPTNSDTIAQTMSRNSRVATFRMWDDTAESGQPRTMDIRKMSSYLAQHCSIAHTLAWSRDEDTTVSPTNRYNTIVGILDGLNAIATRLKTQIGDVRAVDDKFFSLGILNYNKGLTVDTATVTNNKIDNYILVEDIFKTSLSGANDITFNDITGRWMSNTLWNKYTGIPMYDAVSGGSIITFCNKNIQCADSNSSDVAYLPVLFTFSVADPDLTGTIFAVNRIGTTARVSYRTMTSDTDYIHISDIPSMKRLCTMPAFDNLVFRIPCYYGTDGASLSMTDASWLQHAIYGICGICDSTNGEAFDVDRVSVSPDVIAVYPYQLISITDSMVTYGKAYGPIKGAHSGAATIGFAGLVANVKK